VLDLMTQGYHLDSKLWACCYFFRYVLPQVDWMHDVLANGDRTTLDMPEPGF
jgi:hypothetical protein